MAMMRESRSPGFSGTRTGTAAPSCAIESVSDVRLRRKSAPARVPRANSVGSAESTLTENPACFRARIESSKSGKVGDVVRSVRDRRADLGRKLFQVGAAATGHDNAIGGHWSRQPAADDRLSHQGGDLHADVEDLPFERSLAEAFQHTRQPRLC